MPSDLAGQEFALEDNGTVTLDRKIGEGDICDCYEGTLRDFKPPVRKAGATMWDVLLEDDEGTPQAVFIKVAGSTGNNDLVERDFTALNQLFPPDQADEKFYRYLPRSKTKFMVGSRQAHVLLRLDGYVSWEGIIREYPTGIDYRDFAWMINRALIGIGFAHTRKLIHGALIPSHVFLYPADHGAKIIDWSYSVAEGSPLVAIVGDHRDYYAPEVLDRQGATPASDIYTLGKSAIRVLGGDVSTNELPEAVPAPVRKLVTDMVHPQPRMRPGSAWSFHDEFTQMMQSLVGKPRYRPWPPPATPAE
jgi:serine/threonine protein kinase